MRSVVINFLGRTGAGPEYAYEMARGFLENSCKVYAILPDNINNLSSWKKLPLSELILVKTYYSGWSCILNFFPFVFKALPRIRNVFAGKHIDICYVPMIQPWTFLVNILFRRVHRFVTIHDPKPHKGSNKVFDFICWLTAKQADKLIILSKTFLRLTSDRYGFKEEDVLVIPHGAFTNYKSSVVHYTESKKFNFLFFGRITEYKGLDILASAYKKLFEERQDITLTIAGSGDFSPYHKMFNREHNIQIFNCYIPDEEVTSFFRREKTITVVPYIEATQSGVIPIAMKELSLIVATKVGGLMEQTLDGNLAIMCNPESDSLYTAMKYSIEHYKELVNIVADAKKYIESLSYENLTRKILNSIKGE